MLRTILLGARNAAVAATAVGAGAGTAAFCAEDKETRGPSFDPEALERGAKALREINKSPYAKQARWAHFALLRFHLKWSSAAVVGVMFCIAMRP